MAGKSASEGKVWKDPDDQKVDEGRIDRQAVSDQISYKQGKRKTRLEGKAASARKRRLEKKQELLAMQKTFQYQQRRIQFLEKEEQTLKDELKKAPRVPSKEVAPEIEQNTPSVALDKPDWFGDPFWSMQRNFDSVQNCQES